jgi:signal transduction histidine kinase/HAMP domain-containing protein
VSDTRSVTTARFGIGMRWWLALAFAVIAAVTAVAVWQIVSTRAEHAFHSHAQELALGNATAASGAITRALAGDEKLEEAVPLIATRRDLALFVVNRFRLLITPDRVRRTDYTAIPLRGEAIEAALRGETFVQVAADERATIVALPLDVPNGGVLLAYAPRPDLAAGLGIAQEKIAQTALWAAIIGALAGLVVAALLTARLRRINAAAAAIEQGDFDVVIRPGFRDELGELADSVDRMRLRLKESFTLLASERDRLHLLLERLREGVLTVGPDLRVEYANAAARQMLGLVDDAAGIPLPDPWPGVKLRALAGALFDPGSEVVGARATPDADHIYSIAGIPALEARVAVIVITDVSERERRERAQREFVANAAHELRTPLAVIAGAVEMLQSGAKDEPEELDRFLEHIATESSRLGRLARALLLLARAESRAETIRLEPLPLLPLLEQAAGAVAARPGVAVEVDCPPDLAVEAHAELAEQIVSNLAANAARVTEQGKIVLRGRALPAGTRRRLHGGEQSAQAPALPALERESVAIEVEDTGPGIDADRREAVFERFYGEGFGLGLAIVRQAVRVLGGRVELDSEPGEGTVVRVVLPRAEARVLV